MFSGPAQAILARGLQSKVGFSPQIWCRFQLSSNSWCLQDSSQLSNTWPGINLSCFICVSFSEICKWWSLCMCQPQLLLCQRFWSGQWGLGSRARLKVCVLPPSLLPHWHLEQKPLLEIVHVSNSCHFLTKMCTSFSLLNVIWNKLLLGPLNQEVHSIYLFTQFCDRTSHEILFFSVTLGASSLPVTFLLLGCLCLLSSNALCSDTPLSSESLFPGSCRYFYTRVFPIFTLLCSLSSLGGGEGR